MADVRIGIVVLLFMFVLLSVTTVGCADVKDGNVDKFDDLPRTRNGANGGMVPLFDMLKIFLNDVVQHKTLGDLMNDFEIESFSDFGDDEFLNRWNEWVLYFLGFLVCVVVGVLFVLIMPICGCCYCCCRNYCCCCCFRRCRKKPQHEKPSSKCKRVGYGITLFVMSSFLLASVICVYVSNGMMQGELGQEGVVSDLSSGLEQVEDYLDDSVAEVNETLLQEMFKTTDTIFALLDSLPDDSLQAIEDEYQIGKMLNDLDAFTSRLPELSLYFEQMYNLTELLKVEVYYLDGNLTSVRNNLEPLLRNCSVPGNDCETAESSLQDLEPDATYKNISTTEVETAKNGVDLAVDKGLPADVENAKTAYKNITDQVYNQTNHEIEELKSAVQEIEDEIEDLYEELSSAVNNKSFDDIYDAFDTTQEILDDYSFYYTNSIWVLNTLLLFIAVCCFLGLLFGNVLHRPKAWNGRMSCTTHQGANWLMAGIAFTFLFTWLFMLLVTLHFAVGGAMETFGCRHLLAYDDTMMKIEEMIIKDTGLEYNISVKETIDSCEKDASLYEAGNLEENGYNITELLDLEQYGIYDAFEDLKNITIELPPVEILTAAMNQTVMELDSALKDVDYDSYNDELDKAVTKIDLMEYVDMLNAAIASTDPPVSDLIQAEADKLTELYDNEVASMEDKRKELRAAVTGAHDITSSADLTELMLLLTDSQNKLNEHGAEIVTDLLVDYAEEALGYLEDYTVYTEDAIRQDVGACRQLYDAGQTMVYGPCLYFLEPFNAFWFCYGWFIFFSIPTIIFASCLARLYRETALKSSVGHSDKADEIAVNTITAKPASVPDSNKVGPLPPDNRGEVINYGDFTGRSSYTFEIQEKGEW